MRRLKVVDFGTEVQGVRLEGDRRNPEPESFRVTFPGGEVDVTRTSDDDYWVHLRVYENEDAVLTDGERVPGQVVDARLDIRGKHASETAVGDFDHPGLYHLAVRVMRRKS